MNAIETVRQLMTVTDTRLKDLSDYTSLGTPSNISQMLSCKDLKVSTLVEILEMMGYQLLAVSFEGEEIVIDE